MRILLLIIGIVLGISIDMLSKDFAVMMLQSEKYIPILGEFISLQLAYNTGIAFSLPLTGGALVFVTFSIIALLVYYYFHDEYKKKSVIVDIGYICILSGAFSHAYERLVYGFVVDFIAVKYFAILNIADIFISIGVMLLIFSTLQYEYHRKYRT